MKLLEVETSRHVRINTALYERLQERAQLEQRQIKTVAERAIEDYLNKPVVDTYTPQYTPPVK